ncbi:Replication factor C (RF-C) subunit [Kluyveromyces marxianus]|nr:Replication factor C (RF-C) subunit [Kluyveromyces marxianus]
MSLWVDKYRPKNLQSLSFNEDLTSQLYSLTKQPQDLPHLLFYGPNGAGKKTRCMALLQELFGSGVYKLKIDVRQFVTPSNRKLELNVVSSPYHLEITPSDMGNNDRVVIQELIKEVAQMEQVDFQDSKDGLAHRYKCVIINEADSLTRDAQAALRRTMEKYSGNIRLIMLCDSMSSVIAPIKSRCLLIRVPAPDTQQIVSILQDCCQKERVNADVNCLQRIADLSRGNLRMSLLSLESTALQNELNLRSDTALNRPDWQLVIHKMTRKIMKERNVNSLVECRSINYDLLAHCIPARTIIHELSMQLLEDSKSDSLKLAVIDAACTYDERLCLGNKAIYHLEGFIARVMCEIDRYV